MFTNEVKDQFESRLAEIGALELVQEVMHDNGSEFKGEFSKFLKGKNIQELRTKTRDPHLNGAAERTVRYDSYINDQVPKEKNSQGDHPSMGSERRPQSAIVGRGNAT